jgi:hypothetical protein
MHIQVLKLLHVSATLQGVAEQSSTGPTLQPKKYYTACVEMFKILKYEYITW